MKNPIILLIGWTVLDLKWLILKVKVIPMAKLLTQLVNRQNPTNRIIKQKSMLIKPNTKVPIIICVFVSRLNQDQMVEYFEDFYSVTEIN